MQYYPGLFINNASYLQHHGILGQRWGKRNGPPYPLSRSKKSTKEKRLEKKAPRTKEEILKNPTPRELSQIKDELSNTELQTALQRINMDKQLSKLIESETKSGFDTIDNLMKKLSKVNTWTETSLKSYNLINQIIEIFDKSGSKNKKP